MNRRSYHLPITIKGAKEIGSNSFPSMHLKYTLIFITFVLYGLGKNSVNGYKHISKYIYLSSQEKYTKAGIQYRIPHV